MCKCAWLDDVCMIGTLSTADGKEYVYCVYAANCVYEQCPKYKGYKGGVTHV